jgi:glycolate oxidase
MITIQPHASEKIQHQVQRYVLIEEFKRFLPAAAIISELEALKPFECDGLSAYHCLPWLVVLPETVEQVQSIVKCCYQQGVPVVARGAGTGLAGGALPLANGVLLSLARLNRILEIDSASLGPSSAGSPQFVCFSGRGAIRALLCAGSFFTDCLHPGR